MRLKIATGIDSNGKVYVQSLDETKLAHGKKEYWYKVKSNKKFGNYIEVNKQSVPVQIPNGQFLLEKDGNYIWEGNTSIAEVVSG